MDITCSCKDIRAIQICKNKYCAQSVGVYLMSSDIRYTCCVFVTGIPLKIQMNVLSGGQHVSLIIHRDLFWRTCFKAKDVSLSRIVLATSYGLDKSRKKLMSLVVLPLFADVVPTLLKCSMMYIWLPLTRR